MRTFVALLILISELQSGICQSEQNCIGTTMTSRDRADAELLHNEKRERLAYGFIRNYTRSNNMSYLFYNCALETSAYEIAKSCERKNQLGFHHAGSNIAFFDDRDYYPDPSIALYDAIDRWWETGSLYDAPKNIIPSVDDKSRAPFFQVLVTVFT
ncbi:hypothetical protein KIN20_008395 [Parelaphostrongylus tenuis]|uniref:SCP domain-containing protein n=1 Tax=Parelaphostrongylus tenuis TaxID=148309 RepID=A0AAD5QKL5_PARTN|nr:hypothetical protein KIN20_008395 [Parelaphostrongylus tenuis]